MLEEALYKIPVLTVVFFHKMCNRAKRSINNTLVTPTVF